MREIRTHGSIGRGPETDSRRRLNGHEAGNGGHSQVRRLRGTAPAPDPTIPLFGRLVHSTGGLPHGALCLRGTQKDVSDRGSTRQRSTRCCHAT